MTFVFCFLIARVLGTFVAGVLALPGRGGRGIEPLPPRRSTFAAFAARASRMLHTKMSHRLILARAQPRPLPISAPAEILYFRLSIFFSLVVMVCGFLRGNFLFIFLGPHGPTKADRLRRSAGVPRALMPPLVRLGLGVGLRRTLLKAGDLGQESTMDLPKCPSEDIGFGQTKNLIKLISLFCQN